MITGETLLLIIITILNLFLWLIFFVRLKKTFSPHVLLHDIKNEVEKLLIEINKTADEDITLIEARVKGLKSLIEEADKRILRLKDQDFERNRESVILGELSVGSTRQTLADKAAEQYKKIARQTQSNPDVQLSIDFDSYEKLSQETQSKRSIPDRDLPIISHIENSPIQEIPFKQHVIKLAREGFSPDFIAQKLECSVSEVQLIIDLYNLS
ncbi:MAG: hypothetical protein R3Y36_02040 [Spirochaetales bacterium]